MFSDGRANRLADKLFFLSGVIDKSDNLDHGSCKAAEY